MKFCKVKNERLKNSFSKKKEVRYRINTEKLSILGVEIPK